MFQGQKWMFSLKLQVESQIFLALTFAYQATALPELFLPVFLSIFDGLICVEEYISQSPSSYLFQIVTVKVSC